MMTRAKNHRQSRQEEKTTARKRKKEAEQFVQEDDKEDEDSNNHGFASFGFCTVNKREKLQLRNMLLLDSC